MCSSLLTSKFNIPIYRRDLVPRPHLLEKLNAGLSRNLTLVSAPAGFGKTTLLSAWARQNSHNVAWLSLHEEDNDLSIFLSYFVAALRQLQPDFGTGILSVLNTPEVSESSLLTSLLNEIERGSSHFSIVLDDYHLIEAKNVHAVLSFILENQPAQLHLLIATRVDPPFHLARLRARGQLSEFRTEDLRFSIEEASFFLNNLMGLNLKPESIQKLDRRAEGWVAGLQMAALSMTGRQDVDGFIRAFTGSSRFIFDYLIEEVLSCQAVEIQEFMLRTSILDRMCAALCDSLVGSGNSQINLELLERRNLFIIPLDDQRRWFRYHHLFADLLQQRLGQGQPDRVTPLHKKACAWFQDEALLSDAVRHALASKDFDTITDLLEGHIFDAIERPSLAALSRWVENLPPKELHERPRLRTAYAWLLEETDRFKEVEAQLQIAEEALHNRRDISDKERLQTASQIQALCAKMGLRAKDFPRAAAFARQALTVTTDKNGKLRGYVANLLGSALWSQGDLKNAARAFEDGIAASKVVGDLNNAIKGYGDLAGLYLQNGHLHQAQNQCQKALVVVQQVIHDGGRIPRSASYIHFRMSHILSHWCKREEALEHALKSEAINRQWGLQTRATYINLAGTYLVAGNPSEAMRAIQKAEEIAALGPPSWMDDVIAARAMLALLEGNIKTASMWVSKIKIKMEGELNPHDVPLYSTMAKVMVANIRNRNSKQIHEAEDFLNRFQRIVQAAGMVAYQIQISILLAIILQIKGDEKGAVARLKDALSLGEPGEYIGPFVELGEPVYRLLSTIDGEQAFPGYIAKLTAAFQKYNNAPTQSEYTLYRPVDQLTKREQEVLNLLLTDLTSNQIAEKLYISVSTARTHIKRIYSKLDVHSRIELIGKLGQPE